MFKRLVSNLPYSPALISQVGFYAQRLRREEATRRLGLIFTALALVVQSLAVFDPPEAQAVASPQNVIFQGVKNKSDLLRAYDANVDKAGHRDIRQIFKHFGIDREDLASGREGSFNSRAFNLGVWSVGRNSYDAGTKYEQRHKIDGTKTTVFARKLWRFDSLPYTKKNGSTYRGLIGHRDDGSWFAVSFDCGNLAYTRIPKPPPPPPKAEAACSSLSIVSLDRTKYRFTASSSLKNGAKVARYDYVVKDANGNPVVNRNVTTKAATSTTEINIPKDGRYTAQVTVQTSQGPKTSSSCTKPFTVSPEPRCPLNPELPESSYECKPCPDNDSVWYKDKRCNPSFVTSKRVSNITQGLDDAGNSTANPGDKLLYTLAVKNNGLGAGEYTIRDNFSDVTEYADIVSIDGGEVERDNKGNPNGFISWPSASIAAGTSLEKKVVMKIKQSIPSTPQNAGNPESYNCMLTNSFGNPTNVMVNCPPAKQVENVVKQLPATGPGENVAFSGILLVVVVYFYARSRQLKKEVRLLRREFASGSL